MPGSEHKERADALREQERLVESQALRMRAAADRLRRQSDPALAAPLAEELRFQEDLHRGLVEGLRAQRERAAAAMEAERTRALLGRLEAERAERVEGEERLALIAEVRAKLRSARGSARATG
ncbi:hypothetical protein [Phycisphaera mikurensis]|uniref:hypothetical protein n=1 Tax=Phycisphaera mikurensis TaxID=547188 RepID=UPI00059C3303|nr:hypothetical protein [Phycisphaera mikurensis]MBB6440384.1 hypothetical protein [Phycisphaera mikurensis]